MRPTARTLAALRADGWAAEVAERWNPHARVRHDLFNIADILAVRGRENAGGTGDGWQWGIGARSEAAGIGCVVPAGGCGLARGSTRLA